MRVERSNSICDGDAVVDLTGYEQPRRGALKMIERKLDWE